MKNDLHLAYNTTFNHPLQISSPDSVRYHLSDDVRLITMLPGEWPKLRGRDIVNRDNISVENTFKIRDLPVERVIVFTGDDELYGMIVDGKYFFSDGVLNAGSDLELFFTPFAELDAKPMVRRWWSPDYMGAFPYYYTLVAKDVEEYSDSEPYTNIEGYQDLGIAHLADLMAYSYKFEWIRERSVWKAITDEHVITKRIRKPWMQHLVQIRFGQSPVTEADISKLVSFLLSKVELTDEEAEAVKPMLDRIVTLEDLKRMNSRYNDLNRLLEAYNSTKVLKPGVNFDEDPLFAIDYN